MTIRPYLESESQSAPAAAPQPPDEAVVAAIAAAIACLRQCRGSAHGLGASLQAERSGWWRAGLSNRPLQRHVSIAPERHGDIE